MHPLLEHTGRWGAWARGFAARRARIIDGRRASGELLSWPRPPRAARPCAPVVLQLSPRIHLDLRTALTRVTAGAGTVTPARRAAPLRIVRAPRLVRAETHVLAAPPTASAAAPRLTVLPGAALTRPQAPAPAPAPTPQRPTQQRPAGARAGAHPLPSPDPHAAAPMHVAARGGDVRRRLRRAERQPVRSRPAMVLPPAPVATVAGAQPSPEPPARLAPRSRAESAALDLEHLADQVVRQIDRRITAHRERFGRI
jgi:hypothetical protein